MSDCISRAIDVLNEFLETEPEACSIMMTQVAVPLRIDSALLKHPAIQVTTNTDDPAVMTITPLGLINGLFGALPDSWGHITAEATRDGRIIRFFRTPAEDHQRKPEEEHDDGTTAPETHPIQH